MKQTKQSQLQACCSDVSVSKDVWENFVCPEYVIRTCPDTDKIPKEILDASEKLPPRDINYKIYKLQELITDPVTCKSIPRINRLLYDYLCDVKNDGYRAKDLPAVMKVLEFLVWEVRTVKDYEVHLDRMLDLCSVPPLLEKTSESIVSYAVMKQYFTLLGYLLAMVPTKTQAHKIHRAIRCLLNGTSSTNIASVKVEYCRKVMEMSRLPITVAELLEASFLDMYPRMLELVFLLCSVSYGCCQKMLEVGVLNTILIRMDLPYATELRCTRPPDRMLDGPEYSEETTLLIMNTLWSLMDSVLPPRKLPSKLEKNVALVQCAMWGLRYAFKRQIRHSEHWSANVTIRNEIATFILAGLVTFPNWNLVSSGIADDVIQLLIGIESNSAIVLSKIVHFGNSNEDLFFVKILLLIVTHLTQTEACIALMKGTKLMETILRFINPNVQRSTVKWSTSQFWHLWEYALNALAAIAPKVPKGFIKHNGAIRLSMILEWSASEKFDEHVAMYCTKTICSIILNGGSFILDNFREHGVTLSIIKLINYILDLKTFTMKQQRILTLLLIGAENLMKKQIVYQEMYGEQNLRFIMRLLFQCLYPKDCEFQIDQRLLLATGSYIWECIIWCPVCLEKFIGYGAVYIILDILEIVPYPAQCLFLGLLTDICDNTFCGTYLCTWRGIDKRTGLMSLLAKIWREEEIRVGVKRYADGSIEDEDLPQMGGKQWYDTYCTKLMANVSPAIIDMLGSVRSKIYSIRRIIDRDNDKYEKARQHYKILLDDLPTEDRITISCVDLYFRLKLGQVWTEICKYFEQIHITPLGMDGQAIFLMTQRYRSWGIFVKERQKRIVRSAKCAEEIQEKDEYARISDSKLAPALDAFDELDYIRRTTDRAYMLEKKAKQRKEVNLALRFPSDMDVEHCHRTFQDKINVTAIFDQHLSISSRPITDSNFGQFKLMPVSPSESVDSPRTSSESSHVSTSRDCLLKVEEFVAET